MPRGRHDYPTAIHLLRVRGRAGATIFFPAQLLRDYPKDAHAHVPHLRFWESLVARTCDRHDARVHGYAWLPNEAVLLLQRVAVPLRVMLPSLMGQYSRHLHSTGRVPPGESPYLCRCESIEIAPELLPYAVRNLYARPVRAGLCEDPLKYPLSSRHLHFAKSVPRWFETGEFIARVRTRGYVGRASVEQFLAKPESHRHAEIFERLSSRTPQIAGESADIEDSMRRAAQPPAAPSIEQVAETVAAVLRQESRSPDGVLAAALTTWYATRSGAATLAQMGQWFDREPTTLRAVIQSHRKTSAALFESSFKRFQALHRIQASRTATPRARSADAAGLGNAPTQRRGGPSRLRASEGASVCMISKGDAACLEAEFDPERTVVGLRRTRKRRQRNE
jgi:hypothetical protein